MIANHLRLFANEWRNIADAARKTREAMADIDVGSFLGLQALNTEHQAMTTAAMLEDRADAIEKANRR